MACLSRQTTFMALPTFFTSTLMMKARALLSPFTSFLDTHMHTHTISSKIYLLFLTSHFFWYYFFHQYIWSLKGLWHATVEEAREETTWSSVPGYSKSKEGELFLVSCLQVSPWLCKEGSLRKRFVHTMASADGLFMGILFKLSCWLASKSYCWTPNSVSTSQSKWWCKSAVSFLSRAPNWEERKSKS